MSEATSGCRVPTVGTSLMEYTIMTTVLFRANTSAAPGEGWSEAHEWVADQLEALIEKSLTGEGAIPCSDSAVIVEQMGAQYREVRLHSGLEHCEHRD